VAVADRLYGLLPAVYRERDGYQGEQLRELLAILEGELTRLEHDVDGLYDDWFVETCAPWVVPYIGDLLGVRALAPSGPGAMTPRAYVANTISYRRRKGTAVVLERIARDVTGWPAHAVEYFELLGTTQDLIHLRPWNERTPDLRRAADLELLGGPHERVAHTAEVRRIEPHRGRYAIPNVGLWVWRLQAYPVERSPAARVDDARFRFSPLGDDRPLFNPPHAELDPGQLAEEWDVSGRLRRRALYDELEERRQARVDGDEPEARFFGDQSPFAIYPDPPAAGGSEAVPPEEILICDLSDVPGSNPPAWRMPPATKQYRDAEGNADSRPIRAAVDPVLGRIAFPAGHEPAAALHADCFHGFSADIGGGLYERDDTLAVLDLPATSHATVGTLTNVLSAWKAGEGDGIVELADSEVYSPPAIAVPAGRSLEIRASGRARPLFSLTGPWKLTLGEDARLSLNGLIVAGAELAVDAGGKSASLTLEHCTLVPGLALGADGRPATPGAASIRCGASERGLEVSLRRSISGRLELSSDPGSSLRLEECIVDATGGPGPAIQAGVATVVASTVLGSAAVTVMELASNVLFTGPAVAARRQQGCARFSYFPPGSRVPRRYRCQPSYPDGATSEEKHVIALRLSPSFTSERYGDPGYCQLAERVADELRTGASDESEMGAFQYLQQPLREEMLSAALDEYLRFGLEAGLLHAT
jgi:hypothetical protein